MSDDSKDRDVERFTWTKDDVEFEPPKAGSKPLVPDDQKEEARRQLEEKDNG